MATPLASTESAAKAITRVRYTHDAMIDMMIGCPGIAQGELAQHFGFTQAWISRVLCSDAFQARLAERKTELVDPELIASIEERFKGVTMQSLDIIAEKLEATKSADLALQALGITSKALGFGARVQQAPQQTNVNNFVVVVPAKSASEADWSAAHSPHQPPRPPIEGEVAQ